MAAKEKLLRPEERAVLRQLAEIAEIDGQRAAALLAVDAGATQAEAAEASGLTVNQVRYAVKKFHEERLLAFPDAIGLLPDEAPQEEPDEKTVSGTKTSRLQRARANIDRLVKELRASLPEGGQYAYSPVKMLTLVRDTAARYVPETQLALLEPFEEMTAEDLVDPDTWKGIAYMIAYSAQFEAGQAKGLLDERLPEPVKPDTIIKNIRDGLDRFTPEMAKEIVASFEGATREDLLDPDTWKGMAYMIAHSTQFQATRAKDKLNEQLPDPFKPDTLWGALISGLDRFTPETAKEIVGSFEGATKEDLMDPDTWKGVWYMLNYSLQFQAERLKQRLTGEAQAEEEE
ncbi:MAG: helix-turn-helix domain-containing protein [Candidatus Promineifilaceae bacterium]